jgi:TolA-binding protein
MSPPLRAGPYFLAGKALARHGRHEQAALALLRVPILYPEQRGLAAECLLLAAGQLKMLDSKAEAAALYRELKQAYPESPYADAAQGELEQLQSQE